MSTDELLRTPEQPLSRRREIGALVVPCAVIFILLYDQLYVAASFSDIATDFNTSESAGTRLLTVYFIAVGSLMIALGRLSQFIGLTRLLIAACLTVGIGSLVSLVAFDLPTLMVSRVIIAAGAAAAIPTSYAIVSQTYADGQRRNRAFSALTVSVGAGGVAGALAGSIVGATGLWHLGLAIPTLALAGCTLFMAKFLPVEPPMSGWKGVQVGSSLLLVLTLAAALTAIVEGGQYGFGAIDQTVEIWLITFPAGTLLAPWLFAISAVSLILLSIRQIGRVRKGEAPLVDPRVFRIQRFRYGVIILVIVTLISTGLLSAMPIFLTFAFGTPPLELGVHALLVSVGTAFGGLSVAPLLARMPVYRLVQYTLIGQMVALGAMFLIGMADPPEQVLLPLFLVFGFALGLNLAGLNNVLLVDVPEDELSQGSALAQTLSNLASGLATAVGMTIFVLSGQAAVALINDPADSASLNHLADLQQIAPHGFVPVGQGGVDHIGATVAPPFQTLANEVNIVLLTQFGALTVVTLLSAFLAVLIARKLRDPDPV